MKKFISKNDVISQSQSRPVLGRRGAIGVVLLPASEMLMSKAQAQEMTKKKDDDSGGKDQEDAAMAHGKVTLNS